MIAAAVSLGSGSARRNRLRRGAVVVGEVECCYKAGCCSKNTCFSFNVDLRAYYCFEPSRHCKLIARSCLDSQFSNGMQDKQRGEVIQLSINFHLNHSPCSKSGIGYPQLPDRMENNPHKGENRLRTNCNACKLK